MSHCPNTAVADEHAAVEGRRSQYSYYRERRHKEIADALLAGKSVFDGKSNWFKFHAYEHVDCGGALDRILSAADELETLDAIADARQQVQTAADVVAAQIVDDVIRCEDSWGDRDGEYGDD